MTEPRGIYRRVWRFVAPHRARLAAAIGCMLLLAVTTAGYAYLVGPLLSLLITGDHVAAVPAFVRHLFPALDPTHLDRSTVRAILPGALVAVSVLKGLAYAGQFYFMGDVGQRVVADLRRAVLGKLLSLPPSYHARHHSADLHARLGTDVVYIENAIFYSIGTYIRDSLTVVVLLVQAFALDWRMSLIAFGAVPAAIIPVTRFARRLKKVTTQGHAASSQMQQISHEAIANLRVVQAFGREGHEQSRYGDALERGLALGRRSLLIRGSSTPTTEFIAVIGLACAVAYAGRAVSEGAVDGRMFMSFVATVLLMYQPAKAIGRVGQMMMQGTASAERLFELLDAPNDITDAPGARALPPIREGLSFESIELTYPSREAGQAPQTVLRGVDLHVRRGEVVALVGVSGSGKTTLVNMVPRFIDPTAGCVRIDGVDIREATLESLRAQIALVTQETVLFDDTIAANIAYGRPGATREQVESAARAADAHDFVTNLPAGYDTRIGERGVTLSGGQRQRLAIARALLRDAPILLLDEATSALDARSESEVQRALERLMRDRTVLVVAHRLSTIRNAHRIVVLHEGRIVEQGSHSELLTRQGAYARLYQLQATG